MIEVNHLTKRYGNHCAVDDISFTVEDGCIYGLLGPNGAGKSTTMNVITGYLSATSGTVPDRRSRHCRRSKGSKILYWVSA